MDARQTGFEPTPPEPASKRDRTGGFIAAVVAVAVLRIVYCLDVPWNTADVVRHILSGLAALEYGLGAADLPLATLSEKLVGVPWSDRPFNYPPILLLFDTVMAALSTRIAVWKLVLSALEGLSAILVLRISGSRWLALLYWCSPLSIWWVSHEGQLEPVQNVLALAAILAMGRRRWLGWALLVLAIQAKGFAVFLLPWFVWAEWTAIRRNRESTGSTAGPGSGLTGSVQAWGVMVGLLPLCVVLPWWSPTNLLASPGLVVNLWYWNPFQQSFAPPGPQWMHVVEQLASLGLLMAGLWLVVVRRWLRDAVGPAAFVLALKTVSHAQPWYLLTLPVLWLPLRDRRLQVILLLMVVLMDPRALLSTLGCGPAGFNVGDFFAGIDALTVLRLPG